MGKDQVRTARSQPSCGTGYDRAEVARWLIGHRTADGELIRLRFVADHDPAWLPDAR
jgi:hypothetical protein